MQSARLSWSLLAAFPLAAAADVPRVAVDIPPVHSLVATVMGEHGVPVLFIQPGASPHGYSLRPSEAQTLDDADLVVWVSSDLTPWLTTPIENLAGDARHLELLSAPRHHHARVPRRRDLHPRRQRRARSRSRSSAHA